jgi:hypothetical protein
MGLEAGNDGAVFVQTDQALIALFGGNGVRYFHANTAGEIYK